MSVQEIPSREQWSFQLRKRVEERLNAEARRADINAQYEACVMSEEERDAVLKALDDEVTHHINYALTGGFTIGF